MQHLTFAWGGRGPTSYDCIGLCDLIRRQHRQRPIDLPQVAWVYRDYPTTEAAPLDLVSQLALTLAFPVEAPQNFDLAVITSVSGRSCLGTLVDGKVIFWGGAKVAIVSRDRLVRRAIGLQWIRLRESFLKSAEPVQRTPLGLFSPPNMERPTDDRSIAG